MVTITTDRKIETEILVWKQDCNARHKPYDRIIAASGKRIHYIYVLKLPRLDTPSCKIVVISKRVKCNFVRAESVIIIS